MAHFSPGGALERLIRVCHEPELLDEREIDRTIDEMLAEMSPSARAMEEPALRQLPCAQFKPAHLELLTDTRGRLWAGEFTYSGAERWRVFNQSGHWELTVELPDNTSCSKWATTSRWCAIPRHSAWRVCTCMATRPD